MVTRPYIPPTEFVPQPGAVPAQWGCAMRLADGTIVADEVLDLGDITINGAELDWLPEPGTGARYARVTSPLGFTLAIARAVPLS